MLRAADEKIERLQRVIASPYSMTRDDVIRMAREAGLLIPSFRIDGGLALGHAQCRTLSDSHPSLQQPSAGRAPNSSKKRRRVRAEHDVCDVLRGNSAAIRARALRCP